MKLYLASYRVPTPDDLIKLVGKKPENIMVAHIPNAKDYYSERARNFKINVVNTFLQDVGLKPEVVDLNEYKKDDLKEKLQEFDLIWAAGGNTFCLREAMHKSGFDDILSELLKSGVVYGGDSAGAIVVGPTLKGTETADEPEFSGNIIWEGIGVISEIIIPHADNISLGPALVPMLEMYKDDPNAIILNDDQAYVVNGDKKVIVSSGE
ncbi:Type 1 glutamine amidotransferase-like domain-containing protein [Candidatus Saccharibacteria bacterium]|nr:Type 1 glutamine amidotransferase-like domain-containing protein [Candidatus Saccharibacteria bacterium]